MSSYPHAQVPIIYKTAKGDVLEKITGSGIGRTENIQANKGYCSIRPTLSIKHHFAVWVSKVTNLYAVVT